MRDTTERPEAVEAGTVILVGRDQNQIVKNSQKLIDDKTHYQSISFHIIRIVMGKQVKE